MKTHITANDLCAMCVRARVCVLEREREIEKHLMMSATKRNVTRSSSHHKLKVNLSFICDQFFFHVFLFFAMGLTPLNILNSAIKQIKCLKIERSLERSSSSRRRRSEKFKLANIYYIARICTLNRRTFANDNKKNAASHKIWNSDEVVIMPCVRTIWFEEGKKSQTANTHIKLPYNQPAPERAGGEAKEKTKKKNKT